MVIRLISKVREVEIFLDTNQIDSDLQVYEILPGICEKVDNIDIQPPFVTVPVDGFSLVKSLTIE